METYQLIFCLKKILNNVCILYETSQRVIFGLFHKAFLYVIDPRNLMNNHCFLPQTRFLIISTLHYLPSDGPGDASCDVICRVINQVVPSLLLFLICFISQMQEMP